MNEDTVVSVHCYQGDAHMVEEAIAVGAHVHHQRPVLILSPIDSPVIINDPRVECAQAGLRAYVGPTSLERQLAHMKLLLQRPENFFLMHDADSVSLDPVIPHYLYANPDIVWSNLVINDQPEHQPYFPSDWPRVAFQPPYFLSRKTMQAMVDVAGVHPFTSPSPMMPFIDFYMVQLTMCAGLQWQRMRDALSFPISVNKLGPTPTPDQRSRYVQGFRLALNAVKREGANVLHSIKDGDAIKLMIEARAEYLQTHPEHIPQVVPPPHIGGRA